MWTIHFAKQCKRPLRFGNVEKREHAYMHWQHCKLALLYTKGLNNFRKRINFHNVFFLNICFRNNLSKNRFRIKDHLIYFHIPAHYSLTKISSFYNNSLINTTGGPPLTWFSLTQIPLAQFLAYVRTSGGFSC
jgi:hypothetical protein